jgi:hypothetical protein
VEARRISNTSRWEVKSIYTGHNHSPALWPGVFPEYRLTTLLQDDIDDIVALRTAGNEPRQILNVIRAQDPDYFLITKDISNILASPRLKLLKGQMPVQWLLRR